MHYQDPYVLMGQFRLDGRLSRLESYQNTNSSPGQIIGELVSVDGAIIWR